MKWQEKNKIIKFLANIEANNFPDINTSNFPDGYLENKRIELDALHWILAYYNGRTANSPKIYLEALLKDINTMTPEKMRTINVLYNWVYYKNIIGF
jgi:hypothetical protein